MHRIFANLYRFDGKRLIPMERKMGDWLWSIWGTNPTNVFAVGDSGTILHYANY